ncbi:sugar transferase [Mycobacterium sp. SMC-4]|uniref:sugar transferase n=1 Tax=Mycobacterium sp. SMC-4 TaxID=2857059 RepID=UPI00220ABB50|nr:sugar transferase [Mycobacterium sp. SMC-4]
MVLEAETDVDRPTGRATVPQLRAVPPLREDQTRSPRWIEALRAERGFIPLTIALDVWAGFWSVMLALNLTNASIDPRPIAPLSLLFVPIVIFVLFTRGMYKRKLSHSFLDDLEPLMTSIAVAALATLTILMILTHPLPVGTIVPEYVRPSEVIVRTWLWAVVFFITVRLVRSICQRYLRRKYNFGSAALIVGSGSVARQLIGRMRQIPDYGLHPVGLLAENRPAEVDALGVDYLGTPANLEMVVRSTGACELIIAPSTESDEELARTAQEAQNLGMRVRVVPRLLDAVGGGVYIEHLGGVPLMVMSRTDPKGWQFTFKHGLGRVLAALGLLLISPIFLGLMLAVKLSSPGPIFFRQPRVGRDGKVFDCLKFRSMRPEDPNAAKFQLKEGAAPGGVEGEDRRTWIGKIMRKTSLDELPQLLNVVKGDMTLVGPRPERPEFVELFEMQIRRYGDRHRVKAGITGWAQVHGLRGQTSIADRAEFDNYYIQNWSLLLDFKILCLTVLAVLRPTED